MIWLAQLVLEPSHRLTLDRSVEQAFQLCEVDDRVQVLFRFFIGGHRGVKAQFERAQDAATQCQQHPFLDASLASLLASAQVLMPSQAIASGIPRLYMFPIISLFRM